MFLRYVRCCHDIRIFPLLTPNRNSTLPTCNRKPKLSWRYCSSQPFSTHSRAHTKAGMRRFYWISSLSLKRSLRWQAGYDTSLKRLSVRLTLLEVRPIKPLLNGAVRWHTTLCRLWQPIGTWLTSKACYCRQSDLLGICRDLVGGSGSIYSAYARVLIPAELLITPISHAPLQFKKTPRTDLFQSHLVHLYLLKVF